jgi:phage N-6-adenine-methyltransferase
MDQIMFSSLSDEWETPQNLYDELHVEFNFQIDLAATQRNTKCSLFFSKDDDALAHSWNTRAQRGWLNPPYSRKFSKAFIMKAAHERLYGFTTVMLLPARTDTRAFHEVIYDQAIWAPRPGIEMRFIPGRVRFLDADGLAGNSAPFPSMIVVFRGEDRL